MIKKLLLILIAFIPFIAIFGQLSKLNTSGNTIIFKLEESSINKDGSFTNSSLQEVIQEFGNSVNQLFPSKKAINKSGKMQVDLSTIFAVEVTSDEDINKFISQLKRQRGVLYAEQMVIPELCYLPSDTFLPRQYQLNIIKAFEAWDIEKGDTSIVIAITDTGIDIDHEDLESNVAYNYNDPINGLDDDNDGYIDNFRGWDTGDNDNDPSSFSSNHGNNVAGLAGAKTDNGKGIAGTGFNCKFLPIKIDTDLGGRLIGAYDAIIYAADQGADIINCSWGSYTYSDLGNDIINYATSKGSLVVAAVGNDGRDAPFYPAAYTNSLAVGMTDSADVIRDNSNYGVHLDVMAIGLGMWTTGNNNIYNYNGGTSMASPLVAGAAGIVKSKYPHFEPLQIAEHIRNTADNITANQGSEYRGKIGTGRLNMFRSVNDVLKPGVRMELISIIDGNDSIFIEGDTLRFIVRFKNYLAKADNLIATISSSSNSLIFINDEFNLGTLNTLEDRINTTTSFVAIVRKASEYNETVQLKLKVNNSNYERDVWFNTTINLNYLNVTNHTLSTTLSSNGRIGHHEVTTNQGVGLLYKNFNSALYEGSLIIGNSSAIDDGLRGAAGETEQDFTSTQNTREIIAVKADQEFEGILRPNSETYEIEHKTYLFNDSNRSNYIIYTYKLTAKETLSQYYAGLMIDWDILNYAKNQTGFDPSRELAYSYSTDPSSPYFGTQLLSNTNALSFGIDNVAGGNNGIDLGNGFSDQEKFMALSNRNEFAGFTAPDGNDILQSISYGPFNLEKDSSMVVAFAILAADSLEALKNAASNAKLNYDQLNLGDFKVNLIQPIATTFSSAIYPNPAKDEFTVEVNLAYRDKIELSIYNSLGQEMTSKSYYGFEGLNLMRLDALNTDPGIYFLTIKTNGKEKLHKIVLQY